MNPRLSALILTLLSIGYGMGVAILGAMNSGATGIVAMIGALILAALWVVRALLLRRTPTR
jgi:hypothetical protein